MTKFATKLRPIFETCLKFANFPQILRSNSWEIFYVSGTRATYEASLHGLRYFWSKTCWTSLGQTLNLYSRYIACLSCHIVNSSPLRVISPPLFRNSIWIHMAQVILFVVSFSIVISLRSTGISEYNQNFIGSREFSIKWMFRIYCWINIKSKHLIS